VATNNDAKGVGQRVLIACLAAAFSMVSPAVLEQSNLAVLAADDGIQPADSANANGGENSDTASSAGDQAPASPQTPTLKIRVEHSDSLPPLPENCKKGAIYRGSSSQFGQRNRGSNAPVKFALPAWLAGTWQRTQSTEKSRVELPSGKKVKTTGRSEAKVQDKFGTYKDERGNIFQVYYPQFATGEVDRGDMLDCHTVSKYNLETVDENTVCVEVQAYHIVVRKDKRQIVHSYQDEEINVYKRVENGKLQTDSSVKVFDALGKPMLLTRSVSDEVKIAPFAAAVSQSNSQKVEQLQRYMQQFQNKKYPMSAPSNKPPFMQEGYSQKPQPQLNQGYQPQQGYPGRYNTR
jgi:hypothetical protein